MIFLVNNVKPLVADPLENAVASVASYSAVIAAACLVECAAAAELERSCLVH